MNIIKLWSLLKGWKTIIINILTLLIAILQGLNIVDLAPAICSFLETIVHIWNKTWECNPQAIATFVLGAIATLNVWLRVVTNTPIFEKENK